LKLLVALPSFRHLVTAQCAVTLFNLRGCLDEVGVESAIANVEGADVVLARNSLATMVLSDPSFSHVFFIDDDMAFDANIVVEMLRLDLPLVSVMAPRRRLTLERVHEAATHGDNALKASTKALDFVMRLPKGQSEPVIEHGLAKVDGIGMAVTLIRRDVLETMVAKGLAAPKKSRKPGIEPDIFGFFDPVFDPEENNTLSEDYSFCHRWVNGCGGEIFAMTEHAISHIGPYAYRGRYADLI
jgi:hypothetical protein